MSQKGRKPNCTDQQLEVAAYTIYRNTGEWPNVEEFKKTYSCSFERARRAIDEAYTTVAGASVEATHFEALAVYAGFQDIEAALAKILALQKAPSNISKMKKSELRAAVMMRCPQEYSSYLTAEELRAILRNHGTSDDELTNKQKRDAEIDKQSPEGVKQYFALRFSFQEYGSERMRRYIGLLDSEALHRRAKTQQRISRVIPYLPSPYAGSADAWQWEGERSPRESGKLRKGLWELHNRLADRYRGEQRS